VDRDVWDRELAACYGNVLRGLMSVSGERAAAEDALHDALVAALKPGVVERIERVDAWLYAVGVRHLRRSWRRRAERLVTGEPTFPAPGLERVEVMELMRELTPRQRSFVVARYYFDLTFRDIATLFGVSPARRDVNGESSSRASSEAHRERYGGAVDAREVEVVEAELRRAFASLRHVAVPSLADLQSNRRSLWPSWLSRVGAAVAVTALLIAAIGFGQAMASWRIERAASSSRPTVSVGVGGQIQPDARYGFLARVGAGKSAILQVLDELGRPVSSGFGGISATKASPTGRYLALWSSSVSGAELRFFDAIGRSTGPVVVRTSERFAGSTTGLVWANDGSGVALVTTADPTGRGAGPLHGNVRLVERTGVVTLVATYRADSITPIAWDHTRGLVTLSACVDGGACHYVVYRENGALVRDLAVPDRPLLADSTSRFVVASADCVSQPPCRRFVVRDSESYGQVADISLPLGEGNLGVWGVEFRARSNDLIVYADRQATGRAIGFGVALYPDAGRGSRRDLGAITVDTSAGAASAPTLVQRGDGSAVYVARAAPDGTWSGELIDLDTGAHGPFTGPQALVGLVLDRQLDVPEPQPSVAQPQRFPAGSAQEILRALGSDPYVLRVQATVGPLTLATPLLVRALRPQDGDLWLVPTLRGGVARGVFVVAVDTAGRGAVTQWFGGVGEFAFEVPPLSEADARLAGGAPEDPVVGASLVWMNLPPDSGVLVSEVDPMWRLRRASGLVVYVTSVGHLINAGSIDVLSR